MNCNHNNTERRMVEQDYFGSMFVAEMEVCRDCGAQLWTKESEQKFKEWISNLKTSDPDKFSVQFSLSRQAKDCFEEFLKKFPGVPASAVVRAMTSVFLGFMTIIPEFDAVSEEVAAGKVYGSFIDGDRVPMKARFNPVGLIDINAWSQILDMKHGKVVEEAVLRILSLHIESDPKLKEFWEQKVLPQIELIIKAA